MKDTTRKKNKGILCILFIVFIIVVCGIFLIWNISNNTEINKNSTQKSKFNINLPDVHSNKSNTKVDWKLVLVNYDNPIHISSKLNLKYLNNGQAVDERCYPDLKNMMDDCCLAGLNPIICSSYRTWENQETLFNNQVERLVSQGYSSKDAKTEASKSVAVPGTSEHQLGLAVDIVDLSNQNLDESQMNTDVQKWLMKNSWKYGFILRYPDGKSDITKIIYEPWHYRYVGKKAAKEIYKSNLCLEEYLEQQKIDK